MSYDLFLFFEPAIDHSDYQEHFAGRRHFKLQGANVGYNNPDTGVYFSIHSQTSSSGDRRNKIVSAHINLNYFRPSFFGLEAEVEITALMTRFQPRIHDPQRDGMGHGPYSGEGLLRGWNCGNEFAAGAILGTHNRRTHTLPSCTLQRAWLWNYQRAERQRELEYFQYVPAIRPVEIHGKVGLSVVWPQVMPILLPSVDFVLVGREENGAKIIGLATMTDVTTVLRDAAQAYPQWRGILVDCDPLSVEYPEVEPLPQLVEWAAGLPAFDRSAMGVLNFDDIVDSELVASATRT
jgi:hypothetical protein